MSVVVTGPSRHAPATLRPARPSDTTHQSPARCLPSLNTYNYLWRNASPRPAPPCSAPLPCMAQKRAASGCFGERQFELLYAAAYCWYWRRGGRGAGQD
ncbi:hypothetical protein E2C01_063139 [Portunus trituberculatus]|uniref:Uncharacterized protein n=1 Tax=Portunus trituberculatus TaxID=210409 RepID=A0A5B7HJH0_PORTR|nr:hypothetical protein [Portunus trituberculatus]